VNVKLRRIIKPLSGRMIYGADSYCCLLPTESDVTTVCLIVYLVCFVDMEQIRLVTTVSTTRPRASELICCEKSCERKKIMMLDIYAGQRPQNRRLDSLIFSRLTRIVFTQLVCISDAITNRCCRKKMSDSSDGINTPHPYTRTYKR